MLLHLRSAWRRLITELRTASSSLGAARPRTSLPPCSRWPRRRAAPTCLDAFVVSAMMHALLARRRQRLTKFPLVVLMHAA